MKVYQCAEPVVRGAPLRKESIHFTLHFMPTELLRDVADSLIFNVINALAHSL